MSPLLSPTQKPSRACWVGLCIAATLAFALFIHPDVVETANHSYVFLESLFSGRFLHFYEDVVAHNTPLYYLNYAHYNIVLYIIFGLAELPVFVVNSLFHLEPNGVVLYYIGKAVSTAFFFADVLLLGRIAQKLGLNRADSQWVSLFFALSPPAFFSVLVMGQYDSICLFFTLLALLCWLNGNLLGFSLWMGAGIACKFFPILILIPLLLLCEKRLWPLIKYGALSLWLVLPTSLLFLRRGGDMNQFNSVMISRLFAAKLPGAREIPIFPVLLLLLCLVAYLWHPAKERLHRVGIYLCVAVFGSLFLLVEFHPQWIILLMPFLILTTFFEKQRVPWFFVDIALSAGFFLYGAWAYPHALEANLFDSGLLGLVTGLRSANVPVRASLYDLYTNIPVLPALPMVLFGGALLAHLLLKMPLQAGTPASRLAAGAYTHSKLLPRYLWLVFGAGIACWLVPSFISWLSILSLFFGV